MKYLLLVVVVIMSCNEYDHKAAPIQASGRLDSLIDATDSNNADLGRLDTILTKATKDFIASTNEIKELRREKRELYEQLEQKYPNFQAIQSDDGQLKKINDLNAKLVQYEFENAQLRRKLQDSVYNSRPTIISSKIQKQSEVEPIYPDSKSLVIDLDKKIKGEAGVPDQFISVYIMAYDKKSKKLKGYDNCDMAKIMALNARQAMYYNGRYFFNDLKPGKYIIKVCPFYGDYMVINKEDNFQTVAMKVAPPLQ